MRWCNISHVAFHPQTQENIWTGDSCQSLFSLFLSSSDYSFSWIVIKKQEKTEPEGMRCLLFIKFQHQIRHLGDFLSPCLCDPPEAVGERLAKFIYFTEFCFTHEPRAGRLLMKLTFFPVKFHSFPSQRLLWCWCSVITLCYLSAKSNFSYRNHHLSLPMLSLLLFSSPFLSFIIFCLLHPVCVNNMEEPV